jgi:hypothetical protein
VNYHLPTGSLKKLSDTGVDVSGIESQSALPPGLMAHGCIINPCTGDYENLYQNQPLRGVIETPLGTGLAGTYVKPNRRKSGREERIYPLPTRGMRCQLPRHCLAPLPLGIRARHPLFQKRPSHQGQRTPRWVFYFWRGALLLLHAELTPPATGHDGDRLLGLGKATPRRIVEGGIPGPGWLDVAAWSRF